MAESFDLNKIPGDQLVAFYGLMFAAAGADDEIAKEELTTIFELLDVSSLTENQKNKLQSYIVQPPEMSAALVHIADGAAELRYATVVGIVEVLLADDVITDDEKSFLDEVSRQLRVNQEQCKAIINFVSEAKRIARNGVDNNSAEKAIKSAASGLAAVGVPISAVYFGGSVVGLSAAGITSGLAALGLGFGMVPGIGIAIIVGTGIFIGLRHLFGDSKAQKEKALNAERERKAQLVIRNLQETINGLLERIEFLGSKAAQSEANKEAIQLLRKRLNALQRILAQRKQQLVVV